MSGLGTILAVLFCGSPGVGEHCLKSSLESTLYKQKEGAIWVLAIPTWVPWLSQHWASVPGVLTASESSAPTSSQPNRRKETCSLPPYPHFCPFLLPCDMADLSSILQNK
jgi:hypothetical protein